MSDYVAPTDPEERELEIALDSWVTYARWTLIFCALWYVLFALLLPLGMTGMMQDPNLPASVRIGVGIGFTVFSLVLLGGFALVNLIAAMGLRRGAKWGWGLTLALGAIYLPSGCFPFGLILLYGMLNDKTRKLFTS